jgi:ABC-2 type transport system ATP-binding protein
MSLVTAVGLGVSFGGRPLFSGASFAIQPGERIGLVGPNGSGKTTMLRILLGMLRASAGEASVEGIPVSDSGRLRANIGYVPEKHEEPYGWMRVRQLLAYHAAYYPTWDDAYAARLASVLDLRPDQKYGKLSKGQSRRVQLVLALAHRPPVLILDEPTDGLDPVARDTVLALLADHLAESPATVIVSTHLPYEMERLSDHVGVMQHGRLVTQVTREALSARLRRYTFEPAAGGATPELDGAVLRRNGSPREARWTIWGDEGDVRKRLAGSGATVRDVATLTLDEAALALLGRNEP